jgi:hypothetical protein
MTDPLQQSTIDVETADPKSGPTLLVGIVGAVVLVVVVVLLETLYFRTAQSEFERKVIADGAQELRSVQAEQRELLNGYRIVDAGQGVVAIPIERAMELVVEEARRNDGRVPPPGHAAGQGN